MMKNKEKKGIRKGIKQSFYKKCTGLLLLTALLLSLAACGQTEKSEIAVAVLKGPTAIGMVKLMEESKAGTAENDYSFQVAGTADEITPLLIKGDLQMAAIPSNLAAVLYQKTEGAIQICAVNTLGVLYILENGTTIQSIADLRGKTIYSTGKGTTPEFTLRCLLTEAGIDPDKDVTIEYKSEAAEVAALLKNAEGSAVAMLPQPYVTTVLNQNASVRIALNVTEEWEKLYQDSTIVTGVLVVNKAYAKEHPKEVKTFLKEYKASAEYATASIEETATLLEQFGIFKAEIAKKAIPYCNVVYMDGSDMQTKVMAYLEALYSQNPASVGGKLPDEGIFYGAK